LEVKTSDFELGIQFIDALESGDALYLHAACMIVNSELGRKEPVLYARHIHLIRTKPTAHTVIPEIYVGRYMYIENKNSVRVRESHASP
jgi:hypothetical protein